MKEGGKSHKVRLMPWGFARRRAVLAKAAGCPWHVHPALERGAQGGSLVLACSPTAVPAHHHHPQERGIVFVGGSLQPELVLKCSDLQIRISKTLNFKMKLE